MSFSIRRGLRADIGALQAIERDAATRFAEVPNHEFCVTLPVRDEPEHRRVLGDGVSLVATVAGRPVGFLLVLPLDGAAHLMELAVTPAHQGRGIGRALLDAGEDWAARQGFRECTLTTFRDVPWNAPAYARRGYVVFSPGGARTGLHAIIAGEIAAGVHGAPRVAMRKPAARGHEPATGAVPAG